MALSNIFTGKSWSFREQTDRSETTLWIHLRWVWRGAWVCAHTHTLAFVRWLHLFSGRKQIRGASPCRLPSSFLGCQVAWEKSTSREGWSRVICLAFWTNTFFLASWKYKRIVKFAGWEGNNYGKDGFDEDTRQWNAVPWLTSSISFRAYHWSWRCD